MSDGGSYRCLARNKFGTTKLDFQVQIYEKAKIVSAVHENNDEFLKLSCLSTGNPLPVVSWTLNGHTLTTTAKLNLEELLKTSRDDVIYFDGFGYGISYLDPFKIENSDQKSYSQLTRVDSRTLRLDLTLKNVKKLYSSQSFSCYSFNALAKDEKLVEVIAKQKPYIQRESLKNLEILEHHPLLLSCFINGVPEPKIMWYKNDQKLHENATVKLLVNNKFLSIENTLTWHSDNYSCVGSNDYGELELNFDVNVLAPPTFSNKIKPTSEIDFPNDYDYDENEEEHHLNVLRGDDVNLECSVEASPNASVHWVKLDFDETSRGVVLDEHDHILVIFIELF